MAGFSQPSPLENILDKDNFTLEEVGAPAPACQLICMESVAVMLCSREVCQASSC